jgi:uncharacterized protein (DUF1499 family)
MPYTLPNQLPATSRWTSRLAVFSLVVFLSAAILHRLGLQTPAAFIMVILAFAGAAFALVLAIAAAVSIWRHGGDGTARVVVGIFISLLMFGGAAVVGALAGKYPVLNDVTTDTQSPPQFTELAKMRGASANPSGYPQAFAPIQLKNYPDLKPLLIDRPLDETFEVALEALRRQRYQIVAEDPSGVIEAVDRTMILGFYDDIAVRVTGDEERSRIDVRSASRFGLSDFGQNALRVRTILREIVARLEETVPTADGERVSGSGKPLKPGKPGSKAETGRGSKKPIPRKPQDREKSGALREPAPKGSPPAKDGSRAPDKRSAQSAE